MGQESMKVNAEMSKSELLLQLKKEGYFWSYDINPGNADSFSDEILIENTLIYADEDSIHILFSLYDYEYLKKIWEKNLCPNIKYTRMNHYLALFWFDMRYNDIMPFLRSKQENYERFKWLNA